MLMKHRLFVSILPVRQSLGYSQILSLSILGRKFVAIMAAAVIRVLSFSKTTKALVSPSRLSAVPVQRYSADVSSTGETITHTGQVRLLDIWSIQLLSAVFRAKIGHVLSVVTINVLRKINCCRFFTFLHFKCFVCRCLMQKTQRGSDSLANRKR